MNKFNFYFICLILLLIPTGNSSPQTLYDVTVQDFSFTPATLTISVGDTVRWTNILGRHSVVADDGSFTSGPVAPAPWVYTYVFTTAGSNPYYCAQHGGPGGQGMSGVVNVLPPTTFQLTVSLLNGWNMVSVPGINPDGQGVINWWSGLTGTVYEFIPSSGYNGITTTTPGKGYWMKQSGDNVYNTGDEWPAGGIQLVPHDPIVIAAGWNMFGGYESTVDVTTLTTTPPGLIVYPIYKFSPATGYQTASTMDPGYGYWVKLSGAGQINITGGVSKGFAKESTYFKDDLPDSKAGWGKIILTDASGRSYTLYAVKGNSPDVGAGIDLDRYELPPLPPAGIFDIRFSSGRIAEDINKSVQSIRMTGIKYPVRINAEGMDIRLQDVTGNEINTNIKSGEEITISNPDIDKVMVSGILVPEKFELEQNYPNPFNPNTTIKFSIPKESQVTLLVYNMLGEKIKELKNEVMKAGYFDVVFDASNIASGVYLYRIKAGDFVQTKKMLLLK